MPTTTSDRLIVILDPRGVRTVNGSLALYDRYKAHLDAITASAQAAYPASQRKDLSANLAAPSRA
jgi:hypothetical protein